MTLLQSPIGDLTDQAALFVLLVQHDDVAREATVQTLEVTAQWRACTCRTSPRPSSRWRS